MAISNDVVVRSYGGSLLATNLLSGSATNLVLNALGTPSTQALVENSNQLVVGEEVTLGGRVVTVLGSGTMQPGVNVLGLTVGLGAEVPTVLVRDLETGAISVVFPAGQPNLVGAVAMVVKARPVDYTFPGGVLCFAYGTRIATPHGDVAVEDLRLNQRVLTLDRGPRPIKWLLTRDLSADDLNARPNLLPICVPAGALGEGKPARDLVVSPQHRLLVDSPRAFVPHGCDQVLVAALHLVGQRGVHVLRPTGGMRYIHVILARHELLRAEDCVSESFFLGKEGLRGLESDARHQLGRTGLTRMEAARPLLSKLQTRTLVGAICAAGEPLQQPHYTWASAGGSSEREGDGAVRED